jgi:hypothetical protein
MECELRWLSGSDSWCGCRCVYRSWMELTCCQSGLKRKTRNLIRCVCCCSAVHHNSKPASAVRYKPHCSHCGQGQLPGPVGGHTLCGSLASLQLVVRALVGSHEAECLMLAVCCSGTSLQHSRQLHAVYVSPPNGTCSLPPISASCCSCHVQLSFRQCTACAS